MSYQESLGEAFHVQNVKKVAIVDDGYDPPELGLLSDADVRRFRAQLRDVIDDDDPDAIGVDCESLGLASLQDMLDRLEEPDYMPILWAAYRKVGRESRLGRLLHHLFTTYAVDRRDKLAPLEKLQDLVFEASGITVSTFGGQTRPGDLFEYDLIFLDYYLEAPTAGRLSSGGGATVTLVEARERSIQFLRELIELSPKRIPLVMLISSEATADDIPEFRRHAHVLASAVQFLPKGRVERDVVQAQAVLLGLITRRTQVDALWELLALWRNAVSVASDGLIEVVRELDLPDYSFLQNHRLSNEKLPLAHYLVWLFNGHLSSLVEAKLHNVSVSTAVGHLAAMQAVPGRVPPTEAISKLYGSITTSTVPMHLEGFAPRAWAGDIFLRADKWGEIGDEGPTALDPPFAHPMPEVLAVVTPACDLVPERSDKLRTVTTIGGTIESLSTAREPSTHFLVIRDRQFQVTWDPKWPVTVPIEAMNGTSAFEGRYRWVGRLRDMYHADLQHTLVSDVGRVGLPVVPTMPQWSALRVLAKIRGSFVEVLARPAAERAVWTVFSASRGADKVLQLREDVVWDVRSGILEQLGEVPDKSGTKLRDTVHTAEFIRKLQHSMLLKKDTHADQVAEVRVRRGLPDVRADDGTNCDRLILIVFGDDAQTPAGSQVGRSVEVAGPALPAPARGQLSEDALRS